MKINVRYKSSVIGIIISLIFFTACGIKVLQLIDPPVNANPPNVANGSIQNSLTESNIVTFLAADLSSTMFINPGTEVYYRIYSNQEDLQRDAKLVNDVNIEDSENGFNKLLSLQYKKMNSTAGGENPLINANGGNVSITLARNDTTAPVISPTGELPKRSTGDFFYLFSSFEPDNLNYPRPKSGDSDFEGTGGGDYFVNLYAVSTGMDSTTYKPTYSQVLSLGFLYYEN